MNREQKIAVGVVGGVIGAGLLYEYGLKPLLGGVPATATSTTTTVQVPQVTGVTATVQGTSAKVTWQAVTVSGVTATVTYTLQRLDTGATYQTPSTSYTLTGLTAGASVPVQVTAIATVSGQSVQGPPSATYTIAVTAQIPAVTGITATATSPTTATISWQAVQGVSGVTYVIQHTDAAGNPVGTAMGNGAAKMVTGATSVTLSSLTPGAALHFKIAAQAGGTVGPFSAVQTLQMPAATTSGGGGSYTGGNVAQCQSLAQAQAAAIQQANSLQATYNNDFLNGGPGPNATPTQIAQWDAYLAGLQQQIAAAKAKAVQIGQQMQSLGCF